MMAVFADTGTESPVVESQMSKFFIAFVTIRTANLCCSGEKIHVINRRSQILNFNIS